MKQPVKPVTKASIASKPKKAPAKKAAPAPAPPKKTPLSPAAKAYAAKHARASKRRVVDSDEDAEDEVDTIANDILDSPPAKDAEISDVSSRRAVAARPSRRAAVTAKKPAYIVEDDSEVESGDGNDFSEDFSGSE